MIPLVTTAELKRRIGLIAYDELFDDDEDGAGDEEVAASFIEDAQSIALIYLRPVYPEIDSWAEPSDVPPEVRTLVLDLVHGRAALRYREYVRADGQAIIKAAIGELTKLRDGKLKLGPSTNGATAAPTNIRAAYRPGTTDTTGEVGQSFVKNGTGSGGF